MNVIQTRSRRLNAIGATGSQDDLSGSVNDNCLRELVTNVSNMYPGVHTFTSLCVALKIHLCKRNHSREILGTL